MIIYTSDAVFFYCHKALLQQHSPDGLARMIPGASIGLSQEMLQSHYPQGLPSGQPSLSTIHIAETSRVLNVVLHIIYNMFAPNIATVLEAMTALEKYHIAIPGPSSDVWALVLRHAPGHPIQAYALAAHYGMEQLCVEASHYTCAVSLETVTEANALTMGPSFLRKLFFLHLGRREALKRVMEAPPKAHREVRNCREEAHADVARAWALVVAQTLVQPMQQNMQVPRLREAFAATVPGRTCGLCVDSIRSRVAELCNAWSAVKSTIMI